VAPRGEIAIVIGPAPAPSSGEVDDATIIAALHEALAAERPSRAAKQVAESLGVARGHVYQLAVRLKGEAG
jgi:hypothetical protein